MNCGTIGRSLPRDYKPTLSEREASRKRKDKPSDQASFVTLSLDRTDFPGGIAEPARDSAGRNRAGGLSRAKSGVPLDAVKDVSLRTRIAGQECATACPLRACSALRCGLLKVAVWDSEDTASEMTPMQWQCGPTVFKKTFTA